MISGSFCVACFEEVSRYATRQGSRLKLWNESGTNRARIGDSVQLLKRSPQHLALMVGDGTRSSSEPSHKRLFFNGFLKIAAGWESNQKWKRVKLDSWGCGGGLAALFFSLAPKQTTVMPGLVPGIHVLLH